MSLDYDLSNIENWEAVCLNGDRMNPATDRLIWATLAVGLGRITEKNYREFFTRLALGEKLSGHPGHSTPLEVVRSHIGLRTNVSDEKASAWRKRTLAAWERRIIEQQEAA